MTQLKIPFDEWKEPEYPGSPAPVCPSDEEVSQMECREVKPLNYISLGSGSSGNCCYVGTDKGGIIIDAGVRPDIVWSRLQMNGIHPSRVYGVCLTHDHSDHIRYAYGLVRRRQNMRIYCTNRVLNAMLGRHGVSRRISDYHTPIFKEFPFKIADMELTAFDVPHDAADNMGFSIRYAGKHMVIATDLGEINERAEYYMQSADYLVIESNYDLRMLQNGSYPMYLKSRIQSGRGHMDNTHTAAFISRLAVQGQVKYIFLCHLSKDNNTPRIALETSRAALEQQGLKVGRGEETIEDRSCDLQLVVLPRYDASRWYRFT